MRRLMIFVVLGLALAVGAEAGPKPTKPTTTPKPTITKTQAPKGGASKGATVKGSAPKGSTMKATGVHAKGSTLKTTGAQAKSTTVKVTGAQAKGSTVKTKGAQATVSSGKTTKPTKSDTKLAKSDAKASKTETKSAKVEQKKKANTAASSGTSASTSNTSSTSIATAPIDYSGTALGQKLQKNSALRSKIEAKLQAAGYTGTVYEAAYGFKNLGQLNAATNQVQNQGYSFTLLKVLMTGTYVDPLTHVVYRANQLPDGTVNLVRAGLATNPASTQSLGQAKQAIAGGAEMPTIDRIHTTTTNDPSSPSGTLSTSNTTTVAKGKGRSKSK
jgi:hypothetical protein